jgi:hypothetical protein
MYPYIMQGNNITVVIENKPYTINKSHIAFTKVVAAIKDEQWEDVKNLIDPKKVVLEFGNGNVSIEGEKIFWKGRELHNSLTKRMIQMIHEDFPVTFLLAFMENLMQNPSSRAVNELYGFLEKNTLPITSDGNFLAYKKINENYTDCHTSTVLNKPAVYITEDEITKLETYNSKQPIVTVEVIDGKTVISMERNAVNDDQNTTCSHGLHVCSRDYLNNFSGSRIIIVSINPRDVVSIPNDYNNSKMRVCQYTIVDEIDKEKVDVAFEKSVQDAATKEASTISNDDMIKFKEAIEMLVLSLKTEKA